MYEYDNMFTIFQLKLYLVFNKLLFLEVQKNYQGSKRVT